MRRPLGAVALLYMGGILLGQWLQLPLEALFLISFTAVLSALFWPARRIYFLTALLVFAGWTNYASHTEIISPNDLRLLCGSEPEDVVVRGVLRASPVPRIYEWQGRELWHSTVVIDAAQIRQRAIWRPAFGKIIATVPGILPSNIFSGQMVEVSGILSPPRGPLADGLFNPRATYQRQEIYFQLRTESVQAWSIDPAAPARLEPLADRFSAWARNALALGLPNDDPAVRLIWTLALDWKAPLTEAVEEPFMRAGTFHIFAVDGLRIGILSAIGIALLRLLQLPRSVCGLLTIPTIWLYAGITGWPASAVRAAIMMSIVIVGWASHRPVDLVNSLFAAALIILLWDPEQLFQPGFQLSFLVVFCIAALLPLIRKQFQSWVFKSDPFLPQALKPRWPAWMQAAAWFIIDACALSLAAWLGSAPLAAAYFHVFTPISVPANLLVVPITALALMSNLGSLLTVAWLPSLAILFNHASWFFMNCIIALSHWAAHWTQGSFNVSTPSSITFVLYYLVLFTVFTGWIFRSKFKWAVTGGIVALGICWLAQSFVESKTAHVHILPLSGGSAVFVENTGFREKLLFDCGSAKSAESVVKPFLCAHGVNTLDSFALTVGHVQDCGGAGIMMSNFSVKRVLLNPAHDISAAYRNVVDKVKQTATWQNAQSGDIADGWATLHPEAAKRFPAADDNALVFQREINNHSVLLLSTLGRSGQDALLARHPYLKADIVIAALPAQDEPLCEPLIESLRPKLIIIDDSEFPATRRASAKLRERLAAHQAPIVYCRVTGALKLDLWNGGWELKDASGKIVLP